jgi:hypothetical protein
MKLKLDNYAKSIEVLLQSMKYRISKSSDVDLDTENVKHDIMIMHKNLCILNAATQYLFKQYPLISLEKDKKDNIVLNMNGFLTPINHLTDIVNENKLIGGDNNNNTLLSRLFL